MMKIGDEVRLKKGTDCPFLAYPKTVREGRIIAPTRPSLDVPDTYAYVRFTNGKERLIRKRDLEPRWPQAPDLPPTIAFPKDST